MEPAAVTAATPASTSAAFLSARPALRPKSAGVGVHNLLRLGSDDRAGDRSTTFNAVASARRMYTKPRPPSASSALTFSSTATRRPRPQRSCQPTQSNNHRGDAPSIAPQILREEIETQCKVTRHAQREYNALSVQHMAKRHEIAQLQRHLQAFDVEALPSPHRASARTTPSALATPTSASTVDGGPHGRPLTVVEKLQDETRRLVAYKKTLRAMLDRLARHMHFLRANAELLESQRVAAAREAVLCQDKVAQDKSLCAELESKRTQLATERAAHAIHAQQFLASLHSEFESRTRVSEQRHDADRRREEMLRLVESRPVDTVHSACTTSNFSQPPPLEKRHSPGHNESFRMLVDDSLRFFGATVQPRSRAGSVAGTADHTAAMAMALSSRRLQTQRGHRPSIAAESLSASMHRETFLQVYETQYERILEQTGESDLAIVLERFCGFRETRARLEQIERDLALEHGGLDATRSMRTLQLQQLRFSGIAEVEKRKKIRDFLEEQLLLKSAARTQAKDTFVDQLKMFSYVQQGILNITELLHCLDEKFSPPPLALTAASALATIETTKTISTASTGCPLHRSVLTPAAAVEIDWLQSLLFACRASVRATASPHPLQDFTSDQIARLGEIDPTLGVAASSWTTERLQHSIPGGNVVWKSGPNGQSIEDAVETDQEVDDSEDVSVDSDGEVVEDRNLIKLHEAERLTEAELLIHTLDSRQQIAQQEQNVQRMRKAFGLSDASMGEENEIPKHPDAPPTLDATAKLAAVHAFFREKRLREKHEQQEKREVLAALRGLTQVSSNGPRKRDLVTVEKNGANATASNLMAEMRVRPASRSSVSTMKVTSLTVIDKPLPSRKRSNGVGFAIPLSEQASPFHHHTRLATSTPTEDSGRRIQRPPMRPASPASGASASVRRRGSPHQVNEYAQVPVVAGPVQPNQGSRHHQQPKQR